MKKHSFLQRLSFAVAPALALLLGGAASQTQAQPSPDGDWDLYFDGDLKGVAQITFDQGTFTLSGTHIHRPGKAPKFPETNHRGTTVNPEDPRGVGGATNSIFLHYGTAAITGNWGFDFSGKLVGVMTLTSADRTNGMSFHGSVVPGKRITLRAKRDDTEAASVYHGVPRAVMTDISGNYFLSGNETDHLTGNKDFFSEIMTLTPGGSPNVYDVVEHGPGYDGGGFAILTSNKRLGIYSEHYTPGTTNLDIVAKSGTFNTNKLSGNLGGYDGTNFLSLKIGSP